MGQGPGLLDLDLEQLLKWAGACQGLTPGPETTLGGKNKKTTFCSSHLLTPVTSHRPYFYANHLNLYFIFLVEMVSSGLFYAVLTAHHLFAPPDCCAPQPEGGLEHRQRPCRRSKQTHPGSSPPVS